MAWLMERRKGKNWDPTTERRWEPRMGRLTENKKENHLELRMAWLLERSTGKHLGPPTERRWELWKGKPTEPPTGKH
jgi:hypothetical protein